MVDVPQNLEPTQAEQPKKPMRTHGDKLFDRWIYAGLNGVGTFILTIPLAYWGDHGKGKQAFGNGAKWMNKNLNMDVKVAERAIGTTTLGLGGTVMVLPVWLAEHYRKPIVEWFNKHFGNEKDRHAVVENPAPQTFGTLLKGRVVAWLAVFSGFTGFAAASKALGHEHALDNFKTWFGKNTCKLIGKETHDPAVLAELKVAGKTAEEALKGAETKAYHYAKLGALDIFATTAATSILYVTSRVFAKRKAKHDQIAATTAKMPIPASADIVEAGVKGSTQATSLPSKTIAGEKIPAGVIAQENQLQAQL